MGDGAEMRQARKQRAPAAERNITPILDVLSAHLPASGSALEIASGTGQHVAAFAGTFSNLIWTPSDPNPDARASTAAWVEDSGSENLNHPLDIDVAASEWPNPVEGPIDVILAINLLHIAPWRVAEGLLAGAAELLAPQGMVYLYGPYRRGGAHIAESNARFESWLLEQNPEWGVRDLEKVEQEGARHGLQLEHVIAMPANNFSLILRKS